MKLYSEEFVPIPKTPLSEYENHFPVYNSLFEQFFRYTIRLKKLLIQENLLASFHFKAALMCFDKSYLIFK